MSLRRGGTSAASKHRVSAPPGATTLAAFNVTDTTASLSWTPTDAVIAEVGRDGFDSQGGGPWSGPSTGVYPTFTLLIPDTAYTLHAIINGVYNTVSITTLTAVPTLTSISPNPAPAGAVTITGTNFISGTTVSFGGTPATGVSVVSTTQITCTAPAHADGAVTVTVTNSAGTSGGVSFTYQATGTAPGWALGFSGDGNYSPQFNATMCNDVMVKIKSVGATWYRGEQLQFYTAAVAAGVNFLDLFVYDINQSPATIASQAVARLNARPLCKAIEVGNELNGGGSGGKIQRGSVYMTYLTAVYNAVKAAYPNVLVGSAGMQPGGTYPPRVWLAECYANGLAAKSDFICHHPYAFSSPHYSPDDPASWGWSAFSLMHRTNAQTSGGGQSLREIMIANGDTNKKIWCTEYGDTTGQATNDQQRDTNIVGMQLLFQKSFMGPCFVFEAIDMGAAAPAPQNIQGNFGCWTTPSGGANFGEKPVVAALRNFMAAPSTHVTPLTGGYQGI